MHAGGPGAWQDPHASKGGEHDRKDPQDYESSLNRLASHGIILMPTNAQAAKLAALIALRKKISDL